MSNVEIDLHTDDPDFEAKLAEVGITEFYDIYRPTNAGTFLWTKMVVGGRNIQTRVYVQRYGATRALTFQHRSTMQAFSWNPATATVPGLIAAVAWTVSFMAQVLCTIVLARVGSWWTPLMAAITIMSVREMTKKTKEKS